jgi:hypothetical protein
MRRHLKINERGVSNIIVVLLSLIIIVVIVANVILWSYQMNQLDWERMQENISIENVTQTTISTCYNPSEYALGGLTTKIHGDVSDLTSDDGVYMTFRSYYSGSDTSDFVDEICDLYSPSAKGTHSNFTAQKAGSDSVYDMLREENDGVAGSWGVTSSAFASTSIHATYRYMGGISPNVDNMKVTKLHIRYSGTGIVAMALYTGGTLTNPTGAIKRTEAYNVVVSPGWNTIDVPDYNWEKNTGTWIGWCHGGGSVYYSSSSGDAGDFQSARGRWEQNYPYNADETNPMPTNPGSGSFDDFWYAVYIEYETVNYRLDLEVQWTNVQYDLPNEELCIFGGTMGSEDIRVDVWNGVLWQNLFTDLASGWNNITVSSYLTSSTFTIRFKDGTESGDGVQDSWYIDVTLLHVWSDGQALEVEFIGSSSTEDWSQFTWTMDIAWTTSNVSVTLQLYNYALGSYPTSGNGYISYTSSTVPNTDETKNQTITITPTHFRDASGNWKMKIRGVKSTSMQFDLKGDWIEFKPALDSTCFAFKNRGASTSHLVSLWIINSTYHRHYSVDIFLNSGQTLSYSRADISLPDEQYVVKIVTERGNSAVFSEG